MRGSASNSSVLRLSDRVESPRRVVVSLHPGGRRSSGHHRCKGTVDASSRVGSRRGWVQAYFGFVLQAACAPSATSYFSCTLAFVLTSAFLGNCSHLSRHSVRSRDRVVSVTVLESVGVSLSCCVSLQHMLTCPSCITPSLRWSHSTVSPPPGLPHVLQQQAPLLLRTVLLPVGKAPPVFPSNQGTQRGTP